MGLKNDANHRSLLLQNRSSSTPRHEFLLWCPVDVENVNGKLSHILRESKIYILPTRNDDNHYKALCLLSTTTKSCRGFSLLSEQLAPKNVGLSNEVVGEVGLKLRARSNAIRKCTEKTMPNDGIPFVYSSLQ